MGRYGYSNVVNKKLSYSQAREEAKDFIKYYEEEFD
tara:strand:- start:37297 stop:37404 length:108 start_codon:yes stop_codon:yes gene_type:complete